MYTYEEIPKRAHGTIFHVNAGVFAYGGMDWTVEGRTPGQLNWGDQTVGELYLKRFIFFEELLQGLVGPDLLESWVYRSYYRK